MKKKVYLLDSVKINFTIKEEDKLYTLFLNTSIMSIIYYQYP